MTICALLTVERDSLTCHAVDLAFGAGILTFDEVCKKVERIALRDEDELKTAHAEAQVRPSAVTRSRSPYPLPWTA